MSQKLVTTTVLIDGMTCVNCENRIENALRKTMGIVSAKVSYSASKATITYDAYMIDMASIVRVIESHDYQVREQVRKAEQPAKPQKTDISQVLGIGIVLAAVFMIINQFGGFSIFNAFPQAEAGMGYGVLFVIGLLTSIHCVAMCGGINLSQCVSNPKAPVPGASKFANLRPSILYNAGRVISYTTIGGIVGALGSVVSFSGRAKGIVAILAGVFMVIMGLNMLNIFPWLRKFSPRMPKAFARKINEEKAGNNNSPLYVGLLNGLMPCGPLQAMQLYALSTGSPIKGALSMLMFSLGTVPLMFGLGALSSLLTKRFTQKMMQVSAMLVIILGVVMFQNGIGVSGLVLPSLSLNNLVASETKTNSVAAPVVENGIQLVTTKLTSGRYEAITVKMGIPVKWTIQAAQGTINGCNNRLLIPEYKIEKELVVGDNVIEFTPSKTGTVPYSCWMGMIRSKITVIENTANAPALGNNASNSNVYALENPTSGLSNSDTTAPTLDNPTAGAIAGAGIASCCGGGQTGPSTTKQEDIQLAKIVNGKQQATITVDGYGYSPKILVIQKGLATNFTFDLKQATSCSNKVNIPELNLQLDLEKDKTIPTFKAQNDFIISCWMGMLSMNVKVVDDLSKVDLKKIQAEVAGSPQTAAGGCCG